MLRDGDEEDAEFDINSVTFASCSRGADEDILDFQSFWIHPEGRKKIKMNISDQVLMSPSLCLFKP